MAYSVGACSGANATIQVVRTAQSTRPHEASTIKVVRVLNTGIRAEGTGTGSLRPTAGQIWPRGIKS